jgi:hypothetical protein
MSANVLFFSNNCDGSKALISLLNGEKLTKYFHLICTDNNNKIPVEIKVTPTLIIKGMPMPYIAGDAFVWFSKVKQWKIQTLMQRMSEAQKQHIQTNSNIGQQKIEPELLGFNKIEMEGMSDMFAFISEDNVPHAHFDYTNIGKDSIYYAANENEDKRKISETKQNELTKNLESERKKQDHQIKQQIENFKNQYSS